MKKNKKPVWFSLLLSAVLLGSLLTGCSQKPALPADPAPAAVQATGTVPQETETTETAHTEETAPQTEETTVQTEPAPESRLKFQPKVCSDYMKEVFGEKMCQAWFNMVDAMMEGKESFACPDQDTYDWVIGQFPYRCFPIVEDLIDYPADREHSVSDGIGYFRYTVPRAEFLEKVNQFAETVEGILNETVKETDSDFEKALSLYQYFVGHYTYDYDLYRALYSPELERRETSACSVLNDKTGICCELSTAYSYLLMQTGVNATVMMGDDHQWSYVQINGKNYHIDPTFALDDGSSLAYFMMDDQRRADTGYPKEHYVITSCYTQFHDTPVYTADDDTFSKLWDADCDAVDHEQKNLTLHSSFADGPAESFLFSYKGY